MNSCFVFENKNLPIKKVLQKILDFFQNYLNYTDKLDVIAYLRFLSNFKTNFKT